MDDRPGPEPTSPKGDATDQRSQRRASRFPAWFRRQLESREWSQAEFARRAGVSRNVVSQWANGARRPNTESAARIALALFIPLDEVLGAAGLRPLNAADPPHIARFVWMIRHLRWDDDRIAGLTGLLEAWMDGDYAETGERPARAGAQPGQTALPLGLLGDD
jgi:transcriptional regulator with XRE-family HTH domain